MLVELGLPSFNTVLHNAAFVPFVYDEVSFGLTIPSE